MNLEDFMVPQQPFGFDDDRRCPAEAGCAICGGVLGDIILVHHEPDRFEQAIGISSKGYRRVWRQCRSCGSVSNVHMPENLDRLRRLGTSYYDVDLAGSDLATKFRKVMSLPPQRSDNAGRVARVLRAARQYGVVSDNTIRVIDIGAGLGVFLARLLDEAPAYGFNVMASAIEPDPTAAAHLRSLARFEVEEGLFIGQERFIGADLFTLNKVLEHLADPGTLLRDVARSLSPDRGLVYVEVPDAATVGNRPPTDNILGALHCHLYSPEGLALLIRRCGLETLAVERVFEPSGKITVVAFACHRARIDWLTTANEGVQSIPTGFNRSA